MNLQEKIKKILSYCGKYIGHQSMVFERLESFDFNVEFVEEKYIRENISKLKIIILTGEAGDGKSHLLGNLKDVVDDSWDICEDFSALSKDLQKEKLSAISTSISTGYSQKYIVAANMGIFLNCLLENSPGLLSVLQKKNDSIAIFNFEKRNITQDFDCFNNFVKEFIKYDSDCPNISCVQNNNCPYKKNIDHLENDLVISSLQSLCNAVFLMGGHLTIRELLSLISYMITNGKACEDFQNNAGKAEINIYNFFDDKEDILLKKFFALDPAKMRIADENLSLSKNAIIKKMREDFFFNNTAQDKFKLLPPLYLSEFNSFIDILARSGGYIDVKEENELCEKLKYGLLKIISKDSSFGEIVLQDSPAYLGEKIKIQFQADFNKISLFWTHLDFDIKNPDIPINYKTFSTNKLNLSCIYTEEWKKPIHLLIDYNSFRYILMNYDDYYIFSENYSTQLYGFTDFFVKILQHNPDFYKKMSVLFDKDLLDKYIDFDLELYKPPLKKEEKIILKKRDRR